MLSVCVLNSGCALELISARTATSRGSSGGGGSSFTSNCPTNFVRMPAAMESTLGYPLCVSMFEMKVSQNDGTPVLNGRGGAPLPVVNYMPVSRPEGTPWTRITLADAISECASLGARYRLMKNSEWDFIANDIASNGANWSGSMINRGHSDDAIDANAIANGWAFDSPGTLSVPDLMDPYLGTGNTVAQAFGAGGEQKRTHELTNSEILWDFGGNARELVDIDGLGGSLSYTGPGATGYYDLSSATVTTWIPTLISSNGVTFSAPSFTPSNGTWTDAANFIGKFYIPSGNQTLRVVSRGGNYSASNGPGIFAGDSDASSVGTGSTGGFRCVFQ